MFVTESCQHYRPPDTRTRDPILPPHSPIATEHDPQDVATMTSVLKSYEQEYASLTAEITSQTGSLKSASEAHVIQGCLSLYKCAKYICIRKSGKINFGL